MISGRGPEGTGTPPADEQLIFAIGGGRLWGSGLNFRLPAPQEFTLNALEAARPGGLTARQVVDAGLPTHDYGDPTQIVREACIALAYKLQAPDGTRLVYKQTEARYRVRHYLDNRVLFLPPDLVPKPGEEHPEIAIPKLDE